MARALKAVQATTDHVRLATYDHLQSLLFNTPLAATEARITQLVTVIGPRLAGLTGKDEAAVEMSADVFGACLPEPDDVEITPEGIAIVTARGTFTKRASLMGSMSGLLSYEQLTELMQAVADNPQVTGIVLAMDSPGGAVMGVTEAAKRLAAITKPVYVVADGYCASAAYWIAATVADRLYVTETSVVGSIGVYAVRLDATKADKDAGLTYTFVRSGDRKGDGDPHKALSTAEKDDLQERIDRAAGQFFEAIATARKLDVAAIAALEGAAFVGQDAVDAKLADRVGGIADAVAALTEKVTTQSQARRSFGLAATHEGGTPMAEQTQDVGTTTGTAPPAGVVLTATNVVPITDDPKLQAAIDAAVAAKAQEHQDIEALCDLASRGDLFAGFIKTGASLADVRTELQRLKAEGSEATAIHSHAGAAGTPRTTGPKQPDADAIYARLEKDRAERYARTVRSALTAGV